MTDAEHTAASNLAAVLRSTNAATVQVTELSVDVQPLTTVMVLRRPTETILLVIRADRSVLVATDDIQAVRWRDDVPS